MLVGSTHHLVHNHSGDGRVLVDRVLEESGGLGEVGSKSYALNEPGEFEFVAFVEQVFF